ncbi:MAG TPA: hypothetical protein VNW97_23680 [Candidatus Saccharimonadales bacterium]|nr:hypothetical protein [Candidatus Saccharimonadales bacterium]
MKKVLTLAFTMLLAASLSFAQAAGGTTKPTKTKEGMADTGKKGKAKHGKKGGKKSKKVSGAATTPAPK